MVLSENSLESVYFVLQKLYNNRCYHGYYYRKARNCRKRNSMFARCDQGCCLCVKNWVAIEWIRSALRPFYLLEVAFYVHY